MSFLDHLTDLRKVLIHSFAAFFVLSIVCWFFSGALLNLLIRDLPVDSLYYSTPIEAFMTRLKVSFILGLMMAFPYILFRVWAFVAPGLFSFERIRVYPVMITCSLLFYAGVSFCYFLLIPVVLDFLLSFGTEYLNPLLSVSSYFAFVARLCFTFGIVFQLPVVVFLLSILGIVTPGMLLKQWRYGVLFIFVGSAALTPPDAISLLLMALPVLLLYIGSVLIAYVVVRKKKSKDETEGD